MSTRRHFDEVEDRYIKEHAGKDTWADIAVALRRSYDGCRKRARKMGIPMRRCLRWTEKEDEVLRTSSGRTLEDVARELDRLPSTVSDRCRVLGLNNSWAWRKNGGRFRKTRSGYEVVGFRRSKGKRYTGILLAHRVVMEESIGRSLVDGEVVHHIDGDKSNNARGNLHLFGNSSEHRKAHVSLEHMLPDLLKRNVIRFNSDRGVYEIC